MRSDFKQATVRHSLDDVGTRRRNQIGNQARAHFVQILTDRVGDQNGIGFAEQFRVNGRHKRPGDRLVSAAVRQSAPYGNFAFLFRLQDAVNAVRPRQSRCRQFVVTVDAQDFFNQVMRAGNVGTPRRTLNYELVAVGFDDTAQLFQNVFALRCRHINAAQLFDPFRIKSDWLGLFRFFARDDNFGTFAAAQVENHFGRHIRTVFFNRGCRIDAAFETLTGIGGQNQLLSRFGDAFRREISGFQQNASRVVLTA